MQKAVYQDEIETVLRRCPVRPRIGNNKIAIVSFSRRFDIVGVDIDTQVIRVRKLAAICTRAASNIKDTIDSRHIIVSQHWGKLLTGKWRLPQPIDN
jgi:hypothetical protein